MKEEEKIAKERVIIGGLFLGQITITRARDCRSKVGKDRLKFAVIQG